jgi:glucokinase
MKAKPGRLVVGIDLGGTNVRMGLVRGDGSVRARTKSPVTHDRRLLQSIMEIVESFVSSEGLRVRDLAGIGIAAPGIIDVEKGIVVKTPQYPEWKNLPLRGIMSRGLGRPVEVENDANAYAIGEAWTGAGKDFSSFVLFTLGTGVGGGIILDGKIWRGAMGMAGEVGHINVEPDGIPCNCGSRGCLERYSSATGIKALYAGFPRTLGQEIIGLGGAKARRPSHSRIREKGKPRRAPRLRSGGHIPRHRCG